MWQCSNFYFASFQPISTRLKFNVKQSSILPCDNAATICDSGDKDYPEHLGPFLSLICSNLWWWLIWSLDVNETPSHYKLRINICPTSIQTLWQMLYPQTPRRLKISLNQNISSFMVTITRWKRQQLVQQNKVNGIGPRSRKRFRCTSPLASPHFLRSYLATFVKKTKMYLSGLPSIPRSAICARPKRGTSTVHRTLSTSFSCKEVTHLCSLCYIHFRRVTHDLDGI